MEPEHQEHFRRPAAKSFNSRESFDDQFVTEHVELIEHEPSIDDASAQITQVADLLTAETDAAQRRIADLVNRRRVRDLGIGKQRRKSSKDRRSRLRGQLLTDDCAGQRRQVVLALPVCHPARTNALDRRAENWIPAHEQTPRALVVRGRHTAHTMRKPTLYA